MDGDGDLDLLSGVNDGKFFYFRNNSNIAPTLDRAGAVSVTFGENVVNGQPQILDGDVTLTDPDSPDFNGGRLTVTYDSGGGTQDQLSIRNEGNATGQIGVSGTTVSFGGSVIGTITTGGANGADLVVTFTQPATRAAVERLIENLTYQNTSDVPTESRAISITVNDGDGGISRAGPPRSTSRPRTTRRRRRT